MVLEEYLGSDVGQSMLRAVVHGATQQECLAALHVTLIRETRRHPWEETSACLDAGAEYHRGMYEEVETV